MGGRGRERGKESVCVSVQERGVGVMGNLILFPLQQERKEEKGEERQGVGGEREGR